MRIKVTGYVLKPSYANFEGTYVANTAAEIHDLRNLLSADGVFISRMQDIDTGEYYFTEGDVEAMGHCSFDRDSSDIWVYVSDGCFLKFDHIMRA